MDSKKHKTNKLIYEKNNKTIQDTEKMNHLNINFLIIHFAGVTGEQALDDILNCLFLQSYIEDKISEEGDLI